jgi:hypothetical protein
MRDCKLPKIMGHAKFAVLMMLYPFRDRTGHAYPSINTLAEIAGVHRNTVSDAVDWSVRYLGVKKRKRGRGWIFYLPLKLSARQISRIQIEAGMIDLDMGNMHNGESISPEKRPLLQSRSAKRGGSVLG